jgi:small GTP-binding protein
MLVDITSKIAIIGDISVGKTSILRRYVYNEYTDMHNMTVGVDYMIKNIITDDKIKIGLQLWDTAGLERFRSITRMYHKGTSYILIVFDMSNIDTFYNAISIWLNDIKMNNKEECPMIILIGNKKDITNISVDKVVNDWLSNNKEIIFFKTSLRDTESINNIFSYIIDDIKCNFKNNKLPIGTKLRNYDNLLTNKIDIDKKKSNKTSCWC